MIIIQQPKYFVRGVVRDLTEVIDRFTSLSLNTKREVSKGRVPS